MLQLQRAKAGPTSSEPISPVICTLVKFWCYLRSIKCITFNNTRLAYQFRWQRYYCVSLSCYVYESCMSCVLYPMSITWQQYSQKSNRKEDETTTVSCCIPYQIVNDIIQFLLYRTPSMPHSNITLYIFKLLYITYSDYHEQLQMILYVVCVMYIYTISILYCTNDTPSISHISYIFVLSLLSLELLIAEETCLQ